MRNDRIDQIVQYKERSRVGGTGHSIEASIRELGSAWNARSSTDYLRDFVPIRLVTEIEVFSRAWIKALVDHGSPYAENAAALAKETGIKFDYAVSQALLGESFTLGDLVAHSVSINNLQQLASHFSKILGKDYLPSLVGVHDRWKVEVEGQLKVPIVTDLNLMCRQIARLFECRHILVHEKPSERPSTDNEVEEFILAAVMLVQASNEYFSALLHGAYPLKQVEMIAFEGKRSSDAEADLEQLITSMELATDKDFQAVQEAWKSYAEKHARQMSGVDLPASGSLAPLSYALLKTRLTRQRMEEIKAGNLMGEG